MMKEIQIERRTKIILSHLNKKQYQFETNFTANNNNNQQQQSTVISELYDQCSVTTIKLKKKK